MSEQEREFQAAFGEVMFYAYLIEDLVALHIYECSCIHANGYEGHTRKKIQKMTHEKRIDELRIIYADQDQKDGSISRLVSSLHHLRNIRNHLTHAFLPQVGNDMTHEEGIDQILAMLKNIANWERCWWNILSITHETVLKQSLANFPLGIENRDDPPFDSNVSKSAIQQHLEELKQLMSSSFL